MLQDLSKSDFADMPVAEGQVRELGTGAFLDAKRIAFFIGGTGAGKTCLCIDIISAAIRARTLRFALHRECCVSGTAHSHARRG
jgi:hypothetical protein